MSRNRRSSTFATTMTIVSLLVGTAASAPSLETRAGEDVSPVPVADLVPALPPLAELAESRLAPLVRRYASDWRALQRRWDARGSSERTRVLRGFLQTWRERLERVPFVELGHEERVDWILLRNELERRLHDLEHDEAIRVEVEPLLPFAAPLADLQTVRRDRREIEPKEVASRLEELHEQIEETRAALERGLEQARREEAAANESEPEPRRRSARSRRGRRAQAQNTASSSAPGGSRPKSGESDAVEEPVLRPEPQLVRRAINLLAQSRETLDEWFSFYDGYDPIFSWWVREPHRQLVEDLDAYDKFLREQILGEKEGEDPPIVGDPVGREALLEQLRFEMIPYSPEELVAMARAELEWCTQEMIRAAREMGLGDDWKAALEQVKTLHVEPGRQPYLVRDLAWEAIDFLEQRALLTIPPLAREVWRIEMMSPEQQKMNPFFLGGEVIRVSFPTDGMTNEQKLMSMRGNNVHFSRATVHHELIPGHHLQGFMTSRYNPHRNLFRTPFWGEGWALYWELRLWDLGFPKTPEDRIGMLFWHMHRCARVIWSLGFHLGQMTPQEAVDFLVERVGHELDNATAEVRRSFESFYPPLYQAAYLVGGWQFLALQQELTAAGWSERQIHDEILRGGRMPVEMVRARLLGTSLEREFAPSWRFREPPEQPPAERAP